MSDDKESPPSLTPGRLGEALAHLAYFRTRPSREVLERLGHDEDAFRRDAIDTKSFISRALDRDDMTPVLRLARTYDLVDRRLRARRPAIDAVRPSEDLEPATYRRRVVAPPKIEPLPTKDARADAAPAVALPSYLKNPEPKPVTADLPVTPSPPKRSGIESGTMLASEPLVPAVATPFQSAEPDASGFSISQYAKLCAELSRGIDADGVLARHGLDADKRAALDQHWQARMRKESMLTLAFQRAYDDALREAARRADAEKGDKAKPAGLEAKPAVTTAEHEAVKPNPKTMPFHTSGGEAPSGDERPSHPPAAGAARDGRASQIPGPPAAHGPGARPAPRVALSLSQHAWLCAELAVRVERPEVVLARYKISADEQRTLDDHYRRLFQADRASHGEWQTTFERARAELLQRQRLPR